MIKTRSVLGLFQKKNYEHGYYTSNKNSKDNYMFFLWSTGSVFVQISAVLGSKVDHSKATEGGGGYDVLQTYRGGSEGGQKG